LSNMSHEFRTPLASILGLAGILLDRLDGDLTEEQEKQVSHIKASAESLLRLVNDLLDIAKIESGKTDVTPSAFTVEDIFRALRGTFRPLLKPDGVNLVFEEPGGIPMLYTDEGKISQILRNFVSNAIKFTDSGSVTVSARAATAKDIIFSVADSGVGIAPEHQELIFVEFAQVLGNHQKGKLGTGLGLPLARKLARLLGGDVSVVSAALVGSTFSATIPLVYSGPHEA
jgi:signal transduction histidine kinase